jgi:hypothetical protein
MGNRDYIGGHLSTFLYAIPILKPPVSSVLASCCLRNLPAFHNLEHFLAEYQLISNFDMLLKLTQVKVLFAGSQPVPMADYTLYQAQWPPKPHNFRSLLPRKAFCKRLYGLFFKLALPMPSDMLEFLVIIHSPLNLTILFRLISQLRKIGYPSHWLSEILINILENKVITTSRLPRSLPVRIEDIKQDYPEKRMTTAPFASEMATLTTIFQPLLPFPIISSALPSASDTYNYSFHLPEYLGFDPAQSCLVLLFWDDDLMANVDIRNGKDSKPTLRDLLDPTPDDEVDKDSEDSDSRS